MKKALFIIPFFFLSSAAFAADLRIKRTMDLQLPSNIQTYCFTIPSQYYGEKEAKKNNLVLPPEAIAPLQAGIRKTMKKKKYTENCQNPDMQVLTLLTYNDRKKHIPSRWVPYTVYEPTLTFGFGGHRRHHHGYFGPAFVGYTNYYRQEGYDVFGIQITTTVKFIEAKTKQILGQNYYAGFYTGEIKDKYLSKASYEASKILKKRRH